MENYSVVGGTNMESITWMKLKGIIQNEGSQFKKGTYCIIPLVHLLKRQNCSDRPGQRVQKLVWEERVTTKE